MTTGKKILVVAGLVVVGFALLGYKKITELQATFTNMTITPYGLPRKLKPGLRTSSFVMDFIFKNLDAVDFYVTGADIAWLSKIDIVYNNQTIGTANLGIKELSVPAYQSTIIRDVEFEIDTAAIINNLQNLDDILAKSKYIAYVNALGTEYKIGA